MRFIDKYIDDYWFSDKYPSFPPKCNWKIEVEPCGIASDYITLRRYIATFNYDRNEHVEYDSICLFLYNRISNIKVIKRHIFDCFDAI